MGGELGSLIRFKFFLSSFFFPVSCIKLVGRFFIQHEKKITFGAHGTQLIGLDTELDSLALPAVSFIYFGFLYAGFALPLMFRRARIHDMPLLQALQDLSRLRRRHL